MIFVYGSAFVVVRGSLSFASQLQGICLLSLHDPGPSIPLDHLQLNLRRDSLNTYRLIALECKER